MAQELKSVRAINRACQAYAVGGSGHPVYCTATGYSGNVRVISAKTVKGMLIVKSVNGDLIFDPTMVFSV
jgi:hypothetical protein